jgi:two-component system response regulator NreC
MTHTQELDSSMVAPIRILVADDNSMVRRSIRMMLDAVDGLKVIGEAEDGREAINLVEELKPDVVIMDISMPNVDGLQATQVIHDMDTDAHVLILSMYATPTFVRQALRNGAAGYVLKRTLSDELLPALYRVHEGKRFLSHLLDQSAADFADD